MPSNDSHDYRSAPNRFYCEHSSSKSRVFAVVQQPGSPPFLQAVLSCPGRQLADRIATALNAAVESGRAPEVATEADEIAKLLPAAPSASFKHALEQVFDLRWPVHENESTIQGSIGSSRANTAIDSTKPMPQLPDDLRFRTTSDSDSFQSLHVAVRLSRTLDLHIHDAGRLLAAARAAGWEPDDEPFDDRDPHDLLDAAMWVLDEPPSIPGAEISDQSREGEYLSIAGTGVEETFNSLQEWYARVVDMFPADHIDEDEWILTPRTADALHTALSVLADQTYDDAVEFGDEPIDETSNCMVLDRLPRQSWHQDVQWRRQMARAADDLVADLESGQYPDPRSNAEELCLHLAIAEASAWISDLDQEHSHHALPAHSEDYDWDSCSEMLFQDHDILLLNARWADGIENPEDELNRSAGIGDLRPTNWFRPFSNVDPRDPKRGFRR